MTVVFPDAYRNLPAAALGAWGDSEDGAAADVAALRALRRAVESARAVVIEESNTLRRGASYRLDDTIGDLDERIGAMLALIDTTIDNIRDDAGCI